MKKVVKYSIRDKLMVLLVLVPFVSLLVYVGMGTNFFVNDKTAYIYDSASRSASVLSSQVYLSLKSLENTLKPILQVSKIDKQKLGRRSLRRFREQKVMEHLLFVESTEQGIMLKDRFVNFPREIKDLKLETLSLQKWIGLMGSSDKLIVDYPELSRFFIYLQKIKVAEGSDPQFLVALVKMSELYEAFATPGVYASYLIHQGAGIIIQPKFWRASQKSQKLVDISLVRRVFTSKAPQGAFEVKTPDKQNFLVAYAETKVPGVVAVSLVDKSIAFATIQRYLLKSGLFLLAVISLVILISFVASSGLTRSLLKLLSMTREIAAGNFNFEAEIKSNDEVELLAENVKWMSQEVQKLMADQVEQARMESELGMVNLVQKNLFPELRHRAGDFVIECRFDSASEAGGDWFHYSVVGDQLIIWIGDATGHGAPAALITAAAKATSSVIELKAETEQLNPSEILRMLNFAVNSTAKRSVMMTFFVACIDLKTAEVTYANASHEFPIVIPPLAKIKKNDLDLLADVSGKRLGEDPNAKYKESTYQLKPGDTLFFYTDGVTDLENEEGKTFGDGKLLRSIAKNASGQASADRIAEVLYHEFSQFRGTKPLVDDLMYIVCQYDPKVDTKPKAS